MRVLQELAEMDWRSAELLASLLMFLIGLIAILDPDSYYRSTGLSWLHRLNVPNWAFGWPFLLKGVLVTWAILHKRARRLTTFVGAMFWTGYAVIIVQSTGFVPGLSAYILFILFHGWSYLLHSLGKVEE